MLEISFGYGWKVRILEVKCARVVVETFFS
jgi:hypothetical protein